MGVDKRRTSDSHIIAEMISWFELTTQDSERSAYVFDTQGVSIGPKIGEVAIVDNDRRHVKLPGITRKFSGFNRNPYLVSFTKAHCGQNIDALKPR